MTSTSLKDYQRKQLSDTIIYDRYCLQHYNEIKRQTSILSILEEHNPHKQKKLSQTSSKAKPMKKIKFGRRSIKSRLNPNAKEYVPSDTQDKQLMSNECIRFINLYSIMCQYLANFPVLVKTLQTILSGEDCPVFSIEHIAL